MSKRKNETGLDLGLARPAKLDADTVEELKELISKLAKSKDAVEALDQNDLSGMVSFLESFESDAAETKFILHHLTRAALEKAPERLLRWAMVFMLRHSQNAPDQLQHDLLKLLPAKPH